MSAQQRQAPWGGIAFLVVLVVMLIIGGVHTYNWMQDEQQAPVQVIDFSGQFEQLDVLRLERLIRQSQPGSFFALDVNDIHQLLEDQAWVYRASVRKQWPNRLKVYLVEQTPVARWNEDLMLNPYGESFNAEGKQLGLPRLFGPGGSEKTALEGFNAMQKLLHSRQLQIKELSLSERFAWQVQLVNGIEINLGRQEFIDRLQRFVDIYPLLTEQPKAVSYVDLRYDTGLAVGWQNDADNSQSKS
ncbi:cell division protein FtsQ/DivIB [Alteromonas lipolytica]|uniref:Cell division protein FtsQ n=1 Tax=Alteromonas lipolytica TaxID=1856405 RepID=A0A1E8F9N7_9ALTE|nr:cell division protein FtsQ/DivIB [Alteromonas lipolytica]OFI32630.1 cell division protein FtsQ [Alteromonas lipolytica]GGF74550.1 cell division protein FtsQ [Alteromonas lipolytica]